MLDTKDLTAGAIRRQLFTLAAPIIGTSFIQMAYSLTDIAWLGRLGSGSVAAIGAVAIIVWFTNSIALTTKVGAEVNVGRALGRRSDEEAALFASHNITISLLTAIAWGAAMLVFARPVISLYKLEADIENEAITYLRIVTAGFPCIFTSAAFTGIHNAGGMSKVPFYINGVGLIMNIVLDPVLIFLCHFGSAGAALATVISQLTVCAIFIVRMKRRNAAGGSFVFFVKPKSSFTKQIFRTGLPVAALNCLFAVINLLMGRTASMHGGHIGLMTLTAGGQIEALCWNTSQGFSTALSAFVAQNHAAGRFHRVHDAYRITLLYTTIFGLACTALFVFLGSEIFALIVPDPEAYRSGGIFLRIDGYSMTLMMLEITMQGIFYGTGRSLPPAIVSISFNLLRIPLAAALAASMGITGVWWAISATSMGKGAALFLYYKAVRRRGI
jgi:putative MATE family efflux protein